VKVECENAKEAAVKKINALDGLLVVSLQNYSYFALWS
jgi:hypothetical protein